MKSKINLFILTCISFCYSGTKVFCQNSISKELKELHKVIREQHVRPDSIFTEKRALFVIETTIDQLDPSGYLFLKAEIDALKELTPEVASIENNAPFQFYDLLITTLNRAFIRNDSIQSSLKKEVWSYDEPDSYSSFDSIYSIDFESLYKRWKSLVKYQYAQSKFFELDSVQWQNALEKDKLVDSTFNNLIKEYSCIYGFLSSNEEILKRGVKHILFNAYAMSYDPHSAYFSQEKKQRFTKALSSESYQFGFQLEKNSSGQFEITHLEPGGPAWNSSKLHEGDIVLSLNLNGKNVNFSCREGNEIVERISGINSEKLKLKIKKRSGLIEYHNLYSEVIKNVDNHIHGYLLEGEKKVGYIGLPAFYTQWDNSSSTGCANDVGKELMKLQQENIDGLVLDLRNNGGGSLAEALALSGAFVSEGSLCILNTRHNKPRLQKDPNRGKLYNGPLIVLINEYSASASEVTAGILQDFNRAVIVGNPSFGKATGQHLVPIRSYYSSNKKEYVPTRDNPGYLKLTSLELYNLKGNSHQGSGIQPDINLPSNYGNSSYHEKDMDYSIEIESIEKKTYYTPEPDLPLATLKSNSSKRIAEDTAYNRINQLIKSIYAPSDIERSINLKSSPLKNTIEKHASNNGLEESSFEYNQNLYKVVIPNYDAAIYKFNATKSTLSKETMHILSTDPELAESYNIINDLIKLKSQTK